MFVCYDAVFRYCVVIQFERFLFFFNMSLVNSDFSHVHLFKYVINVDINT